MATGELCFSGVPHLLARGCHSVGGVSFDKACARAGEKICHSQKGQQMTANTCQAVGFSSRPLGSGLEFAD